MASSSSSPPNDTCFSCRNPGHWAKDCPFKTTQKTPPSSSRNRERPFSAYSNNGKCNVKRDRYPNYPDCRCQAGKCKIVRENGLQFYVCPITKGHGACSFRKPVADTDTTTVVISNPADEIQPRRESPKRTKLVSPVLDDPDPVSTVQVDAGSCYQTITPNNEESDDDIIDLSVLNELELRERELGCSTPEKELGVSRPPSDVVHRRQAEFLRQISATEDLIPTDSSQKFVSNLISGWLGRLAFPPSGCLIDPQAKPYFCCVFPSFDPIKVPTSVNGFYSRDLSDNVEVQSYLSQKISTQNSQSGVLSELSSIQNVPGIRQGRDFTTQISRFLLEAGLLVQNQLLAILESTKPSNHKAMEEAASITFAVLDRLSVDRTLFSERVKAFIACSQALADLQDSMKGKQSLEEIMVRYDNQLAKSVNISRIYSETAKAVITSDQQLKVLEDKALLLKSTLVQIESQLKQCEMENVDLKTRARKNLDEKIKSEMKLQEAEAAKKLHEEAEAKNSAAKEALESAKDQLRDSLTMIT